MVKFLKFSLQFLFSKENQNYVIESRFENSDFVHLWNKDLKKKYEVFTKFQPALAGNSFLTVFCWLFFSEM